MYNLQEFEETLSPQLSHVGLLCELDLTEEETHELGEAIQRLFKRTRTQTRAMDTLIRCYPVSFATYLVFKGIYSYEGGDYWTPVKEQTGLSQGAKGAVRAGQFFEAFLKQYKLPLFNRFQDNAHRYVALILFHGGIPDYSLPDFFEHFLSKSVLVSSPPHGGAGHLIANWLDSSGRYFTDKPVRRFLENGDSFAEDLVERCVEMAQTFRHTKELDLREDFGLPERIPAQYEKWLKSNPYCGKNGISAGRVKKGIAVKKPVIWLDPWGEGILAELTLQPTIFSTEFGTMHWSISEDNSMRSAEVQLIDEAWGDSEPEQVELKPASKYDFSIGRQDEPLRNWSFHGLDLQCPLLLFDGQTRTLLPWSHELPADELWLVYPADAEVEISGGEKREEGQFFCSWSDHVVELWDLTMARSVAVNSKLLPIQAAKRPILIGGDLLDVAYHSQRASIYAGQPPSIVLPLRIENELHGAAKPWTVTLHHASSGRSVRRMLVDLETSLSPDGQQLVARLAQLPLIEEGLLGEFELALRGPIGHRASFSFTLLPSIQIEGQQQIRVPNQDGNLPRSKITVSSMEDIVINAISAKDAKIKIEQLDASRTTISSPAMHHQVTLQLERAGQIATLTVPLPYLHWAVVEENQLPTEWHTQAITESFLWLDQHQRKEFWVTVAPGMKQLPNALLHLVNVDGQTLQTLPDRSRNRQRLSFNLNEAADTVRSSTQTTLTFQVELDDLYENNESTRLPLLRLTQNLELSGFSALGRHVDNHWLFNLTWKKGRLLDSIKLRMWSLWRPWAEPVDVPLPQNYDAGQVISISDDLLSPGAYRAELVFVDPWVAESPHFPTPKDEHSADLMLGDESERMGYLTDQDPQTVADCFEYALGSQVVDDHELATLLLRELFQESDIEWGLGLLCRFQDPNALGPLVPFREQSMHSLQQILVDPPHELLNAIANRVSELSGDEQAQLKQSLIRLGLMDFNIRRQKPAEKMSANCLDALWAFWPALATLIEAEDLVRGRSNVTTQRAMKWLGPRAFKPVSTLDCSMVPEDCHGAEFRMLDLDFSEKFIAGNHVPVKELNLEVDKLAEIKEKFYTSEPPLLEEMRRQYADLEWSIICRESEENGKMAQQWLQSETPFFLKWLKKSATVGGRCQPLARSLLYRYIPKPEDPLVNIPFLVGASALGLRALGHDPITQKRNPKLESRFRCSAQCAMQLAPSLFERDLCLFELILLRDWFSENSS